MTQREEMIQHLKAREKAHAREAKATKELRKCLEAMSEEAYGIHIEATCEVIEGGTYYNPVRIPEPEPAQETAPGEIPIGDRDREGLIEKTRGLEVERTSETENEDSPGPETMPDVTAAMVGPEPAEEPEPERAEPEAQEPEQAEPQVDQEAAADVDAMEKEMAPDHVDGMAPAKEATVYDVMGEAQAKTIMETRGRGRTGKPRGGKPCANPNCTNLTPIVITGKPRKYCSQQCYFKDAKRLGQERGGIRGRKPGRPPGTKAGGSTNRKTAR